VTKFLSADIHQQVFAFGIVAIDALDGVLHRGCKLSVRAAELLQQHVAESGIGRSNVYRVHQLFYVVVHNFIPLFLQMIPAAHDRRVSTNKSNFWVPLLFIALDKQETNRRRRVAPPAFSCIANPESDVRLGYDPL
jgi:hypothetical protein